MEMYSTIKQNTSQSKIVVTYDVGVYTIGTILNTNVIVKFKVSHKRSIQFK